MCLDNRIIFGPHALSLFSSAGVKFVVKGFVRLRAEVVDGSVVISVEDSGPGWYNSNGLFAWLLRLVDFCYLLCFCV